VPKDPTKNIARYKIEGGHLNEFEFQKQQEEFAEQRNEASTNLIPGTPPEVRAERVEEIQAEARQIASKHVKTTPGKKAAPAKKARPAKKAKPAKQRAAAKTKSKGRSAKSTRAAGKKKPAKRATKKTARKSATKKAKKR
jgi:hypothetical protein